MTDQPNSGGVLHYADCRIDVRVYFVDNGTDDLRDQAIEALEYRSLIPDDPGDCENNGVQVLLVEKSNAGEGAE